MIIGTEGGRKNLRGQRLSKRPREARGEVRGAEGDQRGNRERTEIVNEGN
jgi:hypothetical protein